MLAIIIAAALVVALLLVGDYVLRRRSWNALETQARLRAERLLADASGEADSRVKEAELVCRERLARQEAEATARDQAGRQELDRLRASQLEQGAELESKSQRQRAQIEAVQRRETELARREAGQAAAEADLQQAGQQVSKQLEEVAGLSREEARQRLAAEVVEEARAVAAAECARVVDLARTETDERVRDIIVRALQRTRTATYVESTVSVIRLPSDDMKGRIIGREGRNIRSIEMATGIDLIIDDTPGTVLISCFDPRRREMARIAIERLVEDGRIHPARIEEIVEKTSADMDQIIHEVGEAAVYELGLQDVHPRLVKLLGSLRYHISRGQNLLQHCRETADLAGIMALELGLPPEEVRRAGLLHEVAQADSDSAASPSILASADLALRHGETHEVQQSISAAHPDLSPRRIPGALVRIACHLSRARLGARKHNLEIFISRMRRLEGLAAGYPGVQRAFVFRAGRELRVLVESDAVTDEQARSMSREIAGRIEKEVDHTGPVRVSVLRETRAVGYAL